MVAGLLLAKRGHDVTVLERSADFEREFRGEILQPRFMNAMKSCGLLELVQSIPSEKFHSAKIFASGREVGQLDLGALNPEFPFVTWMTQPNLLCGLAAAGESYDNFELVFNASAKEILRQGESCVGVRYNTSDRDVELAADVVIGADGRFSKVRKLGDFASEHSSHRFDVLWYQAKRPDGFDHGADFFVNPSFACLTLPKYPDLIQCGILMETNQAKKFLRKGTSKIAERLKQTHPMFEEFAENLKDESQFTILQAKIDRVRRWARDGLVLIGDAAHTCSPVFAIGVTIAIETAIVAADVIDRAPDCSGESLDSIQAQRIDSVRTIQNFQETVARLGILNPIARRLLPWFAPLVFKLGLPRLVVGRILAGRRG